MISSYSLSKRQSGLAMLTVTLLLLISATSFTFFSVKSRLMEVKSVANDTRYREALTNAEAGLDHAITLISSAISWQLLDTVKIKANTPVAGTYRIEQNIGDYYIDVTDMGNDVFRIVSHGKGKDGNIHSVSRLLKVEKGGIIPEASLVAAGTPFMHGSAFPNTNGAGGKSVMAGGKKYFKAGSFSAGTGTEHFDEASVRGDNFFKYLGIKEGYWKQFRDNSARVKIADSCSNVDVNAAYDAAPTIAPANPATDAYIRIVWVKGNCNNAITVGGNGTAASPSVYLIVHNGNVSGGTVNGLLFAFNNNYDAFTDQAVVRDRARMLVGPSTLNVTGALVIDYKYAFAASGSITVTFNRSALREGGGGGGQSAYWVPGSWKDFS